jgi:hypothetical protein
VIVLDTNQLKKAQPPDGPVLAMLQNLAKQTAHSLAIPEMVLEEDIAHYMNDVRKALRARDDAAVCLRNLIPHYVAPPDRDFDLVDVAARRGRLLRKSFTKVIRTPTSAWKESIIREANRQPPASVGWDQGGSGSRDAVIWLTIVSEFKENNDLPLYLVSEDGAAFERKDLKPELRLELRELVGDRADDFHLCRGIPALLESLATKEIKAGVPSADAILEAEPVRAAVSEMLAGDHIMFQITGSIQHADTFALRDVPDPDLLEGKLAGKFVAYDIVGEVWACGRVTWQAAKHVTLMNFSRSAGVAKNLDVKFSISTVILTGLDPAGQITSAEITGQSQIFNQITTPVP